jgi:hypothetical protein
MNMNKILRSIFYISLSAFLISGCTNESMMPSSAYSPTMAFHSSETPAPIPPPIVNNQNMTLSNLNKNNQGNRIRIKPGTVIQATLHK